MKIDDALLERVDEAIRPTLRYQSVSHPKLIVTFSGPPSSGKSTISKMLTQRLRSVRLENDAVRTLATQWFPDSTMDDRSGLAHKYCNYSWPRLASEIANGLWVIDSSLDRNYPIVFEFAKEYGFKVFVTAVEIPVELHRQWIVAGGDRPFNKMSAYLEKMAQRRREQAEFLARHKPDVTIRPPYDTEELAEVITKRLQKLTVKQK